MKLKSSVNTRKIIAWIILVFCFFTQLYVIVRNQNQQTSVRLNYIEEEVFHKMDILQQRVTQDLEFLKLEILEKSKYEQFSERDYMKGEQFVTYLQSLRYLRSIAIANKSEVEELTRLSNNCFLKKELSDDKLTLQFTPINVDENAIIVFDTESIKDSTIVSARWFFETIESGLPIHCSYLREDSLTDLHYLSVSSLIAMPDNQYLGLKVDVSMEGFYSVFGPTIKESSILMVDETGHVCCFCNDSANCTSHQRCTFCNRLESEFQAKKRIKKRGKYWYLANGNINYWKVLKLDNWGRQNRVVIATHQPIKKVLLELSLGILFLFLLVVAIVLLVMNCNETERESNEQKLGGKNASLAKKENSDNRSVLTNKQKDKFKTDFEKLIKNERHLEAGYTVGTFALEFDCPRDQVNSFSIAVSGQSFCARLNEERVKSAIDKIRISGKEQLHIDEIFETVGFRSKASFYREFKRNTGKTPKEYIDSIDV